MSAVLDLLRDELRGFAGYSSARKEASGGAILLNANESPWTVPGDALGLNRYPDPQPASLRERLAALYGVDSTRVLVGRGSDEAIDLLVRAACRAGRDAILISPPTFGMYAVCARVQDAAVRSVPLLAERGFALDVEGVIAALDETVKLVFVCSPNNPTGARVAQRDLLRLAEATAGRALLVVDEAYAEFAGGDSALALQVAHPHVAVLRTLSKAYALAGARIGCLIGDPSLVGVLRSIMAPYPLPTPCIAAALAALEPRAVALARSRIALLKQERERLVRSLRDLPGVVEVFASDANFLLVRFADAAGVYQRALAAGIVLRDVGQQPALAGCLRLSIGTPEENEALLALFEVKAACAAAQAVAP